MISVKLKIVPVSNQWLIYQKDGDQAAIGRIRATPNSIIFLLNDTKAQLDAREMDDKILFKITSNGTVLKSSYFKNRNNIFLKWQTSEQKPKLLKCFAKYSRNYLTYNDTKLATTIPVTDKTHIMEFQTSADFSPIVLLASLFPFIGN